MRVIIRTQYGEPDVLKLTTVPDPVPKDNEVLVWVRATSVNASDWEILRGNPLYGRL